MELHRDVSYLRIASRRFIFCNTTHGMPYGSFRMTDILRVENPKCKYPRHVTKKFLANILGLLKIVTITYTKYQPRSWF